MFFMAHTTWNVQVRGLLRCGGVVSATVWSSVACIWDLLCWHVWLDRDAGFWHVPGCSCMHMHPGVIPWIRWVPLGGKVHHVWRVVTMIMVIKSLRVTLKCWVRSRVRERVTNSFCGPRPRFVQPTPLPNNFVWITASPAHRWGNLLWLIPLWTTKTKGETNTNQSHYHATNHSNITKSHRRHNHAMCGFWGHPGVRKTTVSKQQFTLQWPRGVKQQTSNATINFLEFPFFQFFCWTCIFFLLHFSSILYRFPPCVEGMSAHSPNQISYFFFSVIRTKRSTQE